jgi:hypothetical protein
MTESHRPVREQRDLATAPLQGQCVELRPLMMQDYDAVHAMEVGPYLNPRWKFRGTTPNPDQWQRHLWENVLVQYLVCSPNRADPIGLVMAYKANFQDEHAYIAAARFREGERTPTMALGLVLLVNYVFHSWSFRKLYFDTPEYNYPELASGVGRLIEEEARLREHLSFAGERWDLLTFALYREAWEQHGSRLLALALRPAEPRVSVRLPGRGDVGR